MHGLTGIRAQMGVGAQIGPASDREFMQAIALAQADAGGSCPPQPGSAGSPFGNAFNSPFGYGGQPGAMNGFGMNGFGMNGFGPPSSTGSCARSAASSCGCNGNVSSAMPTAPGGAPLSSFDFMGGPASAGFGVNPGLGVNPGGFPGMFPGMGPSYPMQNGSPSAAQSPWRTASSYAPGVGQAMAQMGSHAGGHGGFSLPQPAFGGVSPFHAGHGAAQFGYGGLPFDPMSMNTMAGHRMAGHDMGGAPDYWALDGIGMVHAKDRLRAGEHLTDPNFFDRVAGGEFGYFSGVAVNMDASGNLDGQVYISGHPAAFHQLYDEGREKGLFGEELNQFIAEELTNVNDLDDVDERYYRYWEARGVPRPTRDHDLHNTGSIAMTLAPGQTMSLTGAHQYDTRTDPKYNFTDVKTDQRGTFIDFYRMSNNNNSGNGHHEDVVVAAKIYLTPAEVRRLASGTKAIDIVNERFKVDDDTADYRLSPAALSRLAMLGMPVY